MNASKLNMIKVSGKDDTGHEQRTHQSESLC